MKTINVRLTFIESVLGTASNNKELHAEYIASHAPDAKSKEEEIDAVGVEEFLEKQMTVFSRDKDGDPVFWDYQIKGFFKSACSALRRCKGEEFSKHSCKLACHKKVIDQCIHVYPRQIKINLNGGEMDIMQRPLRASTPQGERVALATSETIPAGSSIDVSILCMSDNFEDAVIEWLDYGIFCGLGSWRSASFGRFTWNRIKGDDE